MKPHVLLSKCTRTMALSPVAGSMPFSKNHSITLIRICMLGKKQSSESCEVLGEAEIGKRKHTCYFTNGFLTIISLSQINAIQNKLQGIMV